MVNQKRDFEPALLHELKHFNHCTQKEKNPNHFCTQSELAKNLSMSLRDVGRTLHEMTAKRMLKHDKAKNKGKLKDRFIPTNERLYESAQMLKDTEKSIEQSFRHVRKCALQMRNRPAIHSIKMLPALILKDQDPSFVKEDGSGFIMNRKEIEKIRKKVETGRFDHQGLFYLDEFCQRINNIFSYIDSLTYATYDDSIEANELTERVIKNLRINTVNEITEILEAIFKPYSKKLASAVMELIRSKIPTYFMLTQFQQMARVKI